MLAFGLGTSASSPRTWGCFRGASKASKGKQVFPTHVGVFQRHGCSGHHRRGLPHARGGVSLKQSEQAQPSESSPRTWGCFWPRCRTERHGLVFPTHVGVFLMAGNYPALVPSLPHARGGVSLAYTECSSGLSSSPRTWGCFQGGRRCCRFSPVFPTHVGVFLMLPLFLYAGTSLPHARGGVSKFSLAGFWMQ